MKGSSGSGVGYYYTARCMHSIASDLHIELYTNDRERDRNLYNVEIRKRIYTIQSLCHMSDSLLSWIIVRPAVAWPVEPVRSVQIEA